MEYLMNSQCESSDTWNIMSIRRHNVLMLMILGCLLCSLNHCTKSFRNTIISQFSVCTLFFHHYDSFAPTAMRDLCYSALSSIFLSDRDVLSTPGTKCDKMIFIVEGKLEYQG